MIRKIFEPCYMEYEALEKPVHYTSDFLIELAGKLNKTRLVEEKHHGTVIGDVTNFTFTDGALYADIQSEHALDDLGYSPYIDCSLLDNGDCFTAIDAKGIIDVALTSSPRRAVQLPNTDSLEEDKMSEETIKILNNQVKDLNKQLAISENKNKANEEKLKRFDELEAEVNELREWKATNEKKLKEQEPIVQAHQNYLEEKRAELLEKISNGNEEVKTQLKDFTLEALEAINNLHTQEMPPQGISTNNAVGLNQGDGSNNEPTPEEQRQKEAEDALNFYKKLHNGETPSFLQATTGGE